MVYGTGLIKGFATTLLISIICSFFTAVFLSRLIFERLLKNNKRSFTFTTLFSRNFLQNTKINFLGQRKKASVIIAAVTVVIIASFFVRGINKGIDFSGGRNYVVQFDHSVKTNEIQSKLMPLFDGASLSVITVDNDTRVRISTNYKTESNDKGIDEEIMQKLYTGLKDELNGMPYENFDVKDEHGRTKYRKRYDRRRHLVSAYLTDCHRALHPVPLPRHLILSRCALLTGIHIIRNHRFLLVVLGHPSVLNGN